MNDCNDSVGNRGHGDGKGSVTEGERRDATTGLDYLRARFLDPATSRFISQDPAEGVLQLPQTLHGYSYASNNPVNMIDPTGEFTSVEVGASSAISGINATIAHLSRLSFLCKYVATLDLIEKGLKAAQILTQFAFFSIDFGKPGDSSTGYRYKWVDDDAKSGKLNEIEFKVAAQVGSSDVLLELTIGAKDYFKGTVKVILDPKEKRGQGLEASLGTAITISEIHACGIPIAEVQLALSVGGASDGKPGQNVSLSSSVVLKAEDKAGLFEFSTPLIRVRMGHNPSVYLGHWKIA